MPNQLKVHSGERVDLVDYVQGANTYTQEAQNFLLERAWLDRRSRVLDGFRIQVEDQTLNPGMITIYNGNAVNRTGQPINNEVTVNDSRSITLLGAGLKFYVEIEFLINESATDARFFMDPTIPNTPPEPDGSEFSLNVATRLTPDWEIVNPVSTTSFEQTSNANSIRVPVGVFQTDGANRIQVGANNPGLALVTAASVMEVDSSVGANVIRVVDSRIFPATLPFNVTVDLGGTTPEARTVSGIDRANGLLTLSVNLGSAHKAGAIVRVTSGTALLVKEKTDPSDPALNSLLAPPGHPDPAQRFWQADEVRGGALVTSKETFGARDDLNIRALKDEVDALSAMLREMKFGSPRPDIVSTAPPLTFNTRPRWFDRAGSITGARTNSVSIGNGTTSFGDINSTDGSAALTAAVAALPATGGTIFVKAGTYTFASTVTIAKPVVIIGESFNNTTFSHTFAGGAAIATSSMLLFRNLSLVRAGGAANTVDITGVTNVNFEYCALVGQVRLVATDGLVAATGTAFIASGGAAIIASTTAASTLTNARFFQCSISTAGFFITSSVNDVTITECSGTCLALHSLADGSVVRLVITNNSFTTTSVVAIGAGVTGSVSGVVVRNNRFIIPSMPLGSYVCGFWNTAQITEHVDISNNYFNFTGGTTSSVSPSMLLWLKSTQAGTNIHVDDNAIDCNTGSFIVGAQLDQRSLTKSSFSGNYCNRMYEMVRVGGPVGGMTSCDLEIKGNVHNERAEHDNTYGVRLLNDPGITRLTIRDNYFLNLGNSSGVGIRVAVELTNATGGAKYDVTGNTCFTINAGNDVSQFVRFAPAGSGSFGMFNIEDNFVSGLVSPTTAAGVFIAPGGTSLANIKVHNNRIDTIGIAGSNAYGIFVSNHNSASRAPSVHITGNDIFSVVATAIGSGIEVQNCNQTTIAQNSTMACECGVGTVGGSGAGIRFQNATSSSKGLSIIDNHIDQSVNTTPGSALHCIVVNITSVNLTGFTVSRNDCRSTTTGQHMIWLNSVGATPTGSYIDGRVCENNLVYRLISGGFAGIQVTLGTTSLGVKIDGNIIQETTYDASCATHQGITVRSIASGPRAVSVSNNLLTGVKTGALIGPNAGRKGIWIRGAIHSTSVCANIVDWNETGVLQGLGIQYYDDISGGVGGTWRHHVVNANLITGDDNGASGGEIDIDTANYSHGYVIGNNIGTPAHAGTIVPAGAIAGWDYGAGTATTFQTYNGLNKLT